MSKKRKTSRPEFEPYFRRLPKYLRWLEPITRAISYVARARIIRGVFSVIGFLFYALIWFPIDSLLNGIVFVARSLVLSWQAGGLRRFLYGLPFLGAVGGCGYLLIACSLRSEIVLGQAYNEAARNAAASENYVAANMYYERLVHLRGRRSDTLFEWALVADRAGDQDRVEALLAILAPADRGVHAGSHLWQAKRLFANKDPSRSDMQLAHSHLLHAVQLQPNDSEMRGLLGQFYMSGGEWSRAAEHLAIAVRQKPEFLLLFAKAHALLGHVETAETHGERAQQYFQGLVSRDQKNVEARVGWAEATMFLEQFPQAIAILREGSIFSDDARLPKGLARVYITWSDSLSDSPQNRVRKLQLLEEGLQADPTELMLFDRIMTVLKRDDETSQKAREFLIANVARGQAQILSHLLLGTYEGEVGNVEKGISHLEQAYNLNSSMAVVANNLAWFLMERDPPELERAYSLADNLAKRWPSTAAYRDTRGQILVKMKRWHEALGDLQAALSHMPDNLRLHATLAETYSQLNMAELAAEHRKIAGQLARRNGTNPEVQDRPNG